jgi:hypothetical protein
LLVILYSINVFKLGFLSFYMANGDGQGFETERYEYHAPSVGKDNECIALKRGQRGVISSVKIEGETEYIQLLGAPEKGCYLSDLVAKRAGGVSICDLRFGQMQALAQLVDEDRREELMADLKQIALIQEQVLLGSQKDDFHVAMSS